MQFFGIILRHAELFEKLHDLSIFSRNSASVPELPGSSYGAVLGSISARHHWVRHPCIEIRSRRSVEVSEKTLAYSDTHRPGEFFLRVPPPSCNIHQNS